MISEFPLLIQLTLVVSAILALSSWIVSVIQAVRSKQNYILAMVPMTQPFLAIVRLFAQGRWSKTPGFLLIGALILFGFGPMAVESIERSRLLSFVDQVEAKGYNSDLESRISQHESIPAEQNSWRSPFLEPLYLYAKHLSSSEPGSLLASEAQKGLDRYDSLTPKEIPLRFEYEADSYTPIISNIHPIRRTLENSARVRYASNPNSQQSELPKELKSVAKVMAQFYEGHNESFDQFEEAVSRDKSAYYYNLDRGPFRIRFPHLEYIKRFAFALNDRMIVRLILGEQEAAWKDWKTLSLLRNMQERDLDMLITLLVQLSHYQVMIESAHAAQALGAWDVEKWKQIETEFARWDARKKVIEGLKMEVAMLTAEGVYIAKNSPKEKFDLQRVAMNVIDTKNRSSDSRLTKTMAYLKIDFWSQLSPSTIRALINSEIRSGLSKRFSDIEDVIDLLGIGDPRNDYDPSTTLHVPIPGNLAEHSDSELKSESIYRIYEKTLVLETRILIARVACRLETYRMKNGHYPDGLELIQQSGLEEITYEKIGAKGFSLSINLPDWFSDIHEVIWKIDGQPPTLPEYQLF